MSYPSLIAETVMFSGHNGDRGEAYYARPTRAEKFPGIVVIHHLPGWDEWIIEVVRDVAGAMAFLRAQPNANGKVGIIGFCSGGRHAYLCACRIDHIDAVVDCWGGNVIVDDKSQLNDKRPVAPIDLTENLRAPLLGLFGNDDQNPNPDQVNRTEAVLRRLGKNYEFHRYPDAGHAFFNTKRTAFRAEQAADGWAKIFTFLRRHLAA